MILKKFTFLTLLITFTLSIAAPSFAQPNLTNFPTYTDENGRVTTVTTNEVLATLMDTDHMFLWTPVLIEAFSLCVEFVENSTAVDDGWFAPTRKVSLSPHKKEFIIRVLYENPTHLEMFTMHIATICTLAARNQSGAERDEHIRKLKLAMILPSFEESWQESNPLPDYLKPPVFSFPSFQNEPVTRDELLQILSGGILYEEAESVLQHGTYAVTHFTECARIVRDTPESIAIDAPVYEHSNIPTQKRRFIIDTLIENPELLEPLMPEVNLICANALQDTDMSEYYFIIELLDSGLFTIEELSQMIKDDQ